MKVGKLFFNLVNDEDRTLLTKSRHVWIHHVEGKEQCGRSDMFGRSKVTHDVIHPAIYCLFGGEMGGKISIKVNGHDNRRL